MSYSTTPFPTMPLLDDTIKTVWESGWLDEYSEEHFLIQAIRGTIPNFRTRALMDSVSPGLYYEVDGNSANFVNNFSNRLRGAIRLYGSVQAEEFIRDKLSAGKQNYSEDQFFQSLHEIHFLSYFTIYGSPSVEYEPPLGGVSGRRNPEFRIRNRFEILGLTYKSRPSVKMEDYILDIEVKTVEGKLNPAIDKTTPFLTPTIPIRYEERRQLLDFCAERGFQLELPDVMQLKSFLNDADKFEPPTKENHFNILCINWTHRELPKINFMEPLSLLDNEKNGLLRYQEIGRAFGLRQEVFDRISAIFICSYPKQALMFGDVRWVFSNHMVSVLFSPVLNDTQRLKLKHILGMAPSANPKPPLLITNSPLQSLYAHIAFNAHMEGIDTILEEIKYTGGVNPNDLTPTPWG